MSDHDTTPPDFSGSGPVSYSPAPEESAGRVPAATEASLLATPGVTSVGIGRTPDGRDAVVVGVEDASVTAHLPPEIAGMPVLITVTGPVEAQRPR